MHPFFQRKRKEGRKQASKPWSSWLKQENETGAEDNIATWSKWPGPSVLTRGSSPTRCVQLTPNPLCLGFCMWKTRDCKSVSRYLSAVASKKEWEGTEYTGCAALISYQSMSPSHVAPEFPHASKKFKSVEKFLQQNSSFQDHSQQLESLNPCPASLIYSISTARPF